MKSSDFTFKAPISIAATDKYNNNFLKNIYIFRVTMAWLFAWQATKFENDVHCKF